MNACTTRRSSGLPREVLLDKARALILHHDPVSREVVLHPRLHAFARHWGFRVRDYLRTELPLEVLMMAIQRQRPKPGLLHHSDRGGQYASAEYRAVLKTNGMVQFMGCAGNCWDNAPMENFFGTAKVELAITRPYPTSEAVRRDRSPASKATIIDSASIRPSATSHPSRPSKAPHNPESTGSGQGHQELPPR